MRKQRRFVSATRQQKRRKKFLISMAVFLAMLLGTAAIYIAFMHYHFSPNTFIEGICCTWLSPEKAKTEIEKGLSDSTIVISFNHAKKHAVLGKKFGIYLKNDDEIRDILKEQNLKFNSKVKEYSLHSSIAVDKQKVKEYLQSLQEMQAKNMTEAQDAYIEWKDAEKQLVIVPEVYGWNISIDKACELICENIADGNDFIDFTSMMTAPKITADDLKGDVDELNAILLTTINWKLCDGSTYTLDYNVMKDWIHQSEDGSYSINLEEQAVTIAERLIEETNNRSFSMKFKSSSLGEEIYIPVQNSLKPKINKEEEIAQIMNCFAMPANYACLPKYTTLPMNEQLASYVELDITAQKVWLYKDEECILETLCVTGDVDGGHDTPTGIYYLTYKTTDKVLKGYNNDGSKYASHVNYWMSFNGGIGFHDALWRDKFGGTIYKTNGSHGCVNMPLDAAKTLYENIDFSMPIIVYKS